MNSKSGNMLFIILVAIAVLGLLATVLIRSDNSSSESGLTENSSIRASTAVKFAGGVQTGVQSLLTRGCSENQISFWHGDTNSSGVEDAGDENFNPNAPTNNSCHVFHVNGAGIKYVDIRPLVSPSSPSQVLAGFTIGPAHRILVGIGSDKRTDVFLTAYSNTTGNFLYMVPFCEAVNRIAGVQKTGTAPAGEFDPYASSLSVISIGEQFVGTFHDSPTPVLYSFPGLVGKQFFCGGMSGSKAIFVATVMAR